MDATNTVTLEKDAFASAHIDQRSDKGDEESFSEAERADQAAAAAADKTLLRKIDVRLIPFLALLYLLSFLDRSAIGNARLFGLSASLGLTDAQYLLTLTIFFFSYSAFEVPSNVLLKLLRPSLWLPGIMVACGICMLAQGLVSNYAGLLAARFALGIAEAGLFPGVNYYLSCWYKRTEFGLRAAAFFSAATAAGAFGGLLAAAIGGNMNGVGGKPGWTWIFIIEGIITVVIAVIGFWLVHDFPDTAKFLTDDERVRVIGRLQADDQFSAAGEAFAWSNLTLALKDWKTWCGMVIYAGILGPLYAFSLFLPSIVSQFGYNATTSNLLTVPVYVYACIWTVSVGYYADKIGKRLVFNFGCLAMGMVGYTILIVSRNAQLSYFAIFLAASGVYPVVPNTISLVANNVEGSMKRSVAIGMVVGFGNMNGAVSSNVYRAVQKPWYPLGHGIVLAYLSLAFVASGYYYYYARAENRLRETGARDEVIGGEPLALGELRDGKGHGGWYPTVEAAKAAKGDMWSGYRYML